MALIVGHSQAKYLCDYLDKEHFSVFSYPGYGVDQFGAETVIFEVAPYFSKSRPKMVAPQENAYKNPTNCGVYFLSGCDTDVVRNSLDTVLQKIKCKQNAEDKSHTVLLSSKQQLTSLSSIRGYAQYYVTLCRKYNLLKNERMTLLLPMDELIAIQLCLAEKNKQERGDFDVETSVVLQAVKDLNRKKLEPDYEVTSCTQDSGILELYQNFLRDCNYVDSCDVFGKVRDELGRNEELQRELRNSTVIILDYPKSMVEVKMAEFLCQGKPIHKVSVEVPLDGEEELSVEITDGDVSDLSNTNIGLSTVKKPPSLTEAYVRLVFLSYLDLLINSRSELSLARVFNVPERELTHSAFTGLKHEAKQKKMTMYQTATSYVMKIRLGGKGYAPDPNSSLQPHIKGISEFVTLMQRMETVVEEDPDIRSACKRTINILKKELIKCRDSKIRNSSVESVAEQLQDQITVIIDQLDTNLFTTPDKAPANGGSLTSRRARKAIRLTLDKLATVADDLSSLDHLTDIYSSQRTPLRFPSVLSQFRSPEEELEESSPDNKFTMSLSERVMNRMNKPETPVYAKRYKSSMDWAEPLHKVDIGQKDDIFSPSQSYVIPCKTIVHAGNRLSTGEANKALEAMLEKENVTEKEIVLEPISNINTKQGNGKDSKQAGKQKKTQSNKRPLEVDNQSSQSSQPAKKKKETQSKSCRRKLLPQVKGQQQLSKFFRV